MFNEYERDNNLIPIQKKKLQHVTRFSLPISSYLFTLVFVTARTNKIVHSNSIVYRCLVAVFQQEVKRKHE